MLAAAGALCLAATGTAAAVSSAAPSASPVQAAEMLSFHTTVRAQQTGKVQQPAQGNLAEQAIIEAADRAAAAHATAVAAARAAASRAAAARAAARAAAERAAARRAARQAAARQAAAQQATAAAAQQAPAGTPQQIAALMLAQHGWAGQFSCLDSLWAQESGWNVYAENPSSGAYGIPQALPGSKMASAGMGWQSDAVTQISWGLAYIQAMYGSPCGAWAHEEDAGWY